MPSLHYIPGKDAALETSIATLQARLAALGFQVEERSTLNPVEGVWSIHLRDRDCPLLYTNGKGASELAARASALGEFFERLACQYFWSHYHLGASIADSRFAHYPQERWFPLPANGRWPRELLTPELCDFYNPERSIGARTLVDHNSGNVGRGICALPFRRLRDDATVWFPANILGNLYVSNGMAAGNTPQEARAQALSEILERHVKFEVIRNGLCLPDVPAAVIDRHPRIAQGIAALRNAGYGVLVKDASLGGRYPVMNVTLLNPRDQGCFASFGAHPRGEIALERALTELLQGRALDQLDGFPAPGFDLDEIAQAPNLEIHFVDSSGILSWDFLGSRPDHAFCDWNFSTSTEDDYTWLCRCIRDAGHDIYIADHDHLGVYACRIVVPGMSEIYPLDDLEWENNSVGNLLRPTIARLPHLDADECAALLTVLELQDVDDMRPVAALIGLAPDPGSVWETLRVGELRLALALAAGQHEAAREACHWTAQFDEIPVPRRRLHRCLQVLLNPPASGLERGALLALYGEETLDHASAMLRGERCFAGWAALGEDFEGSAAHRALLAALDKARDAHA